MPGLAAIGLAVLGVVVLAVPACTDDAWDARPVGRDDAVSAPARAARRPRGRPGDRQPDRPVLPPHADEIGAAHADRRSAIRWRVRRRLARTRSVSAPARGRRANRRLARSRSRWSRRRAQSLGGASGGDYTARTSSTTPSRSPKGSSRSPVSATTRSSARSRACRCRCVRGDVFLSVTVPFGLTDADAAAVRALAPTAVGRLP